MIGSKLLRESRNIFIGQNGYTAGRNNLTPYFGGYYDKNILPKIRSISEYCIKNKWVPVDIKNLAKEYLRKEMDFYNKWEDTTLDHMPPEKPFAFAEKQKAVLDYHAYVVKFNSQFKSWAENFIKTKKTGNLPKDTPLAEIIQLNNFMLLAKEVDEFINRKF